MTHTPVHGSLQRPLLPIFLLLGLTLGACVPPVSTSAPLVALDRSLPAPALERIERTAQADVSGELQTGSRLIGSERLTRDSIYPGARTTNFTLPEPETLETLFQRARRLVEIESSTDLSAIRLDLVDDESLFAEVFEETRRLVHGQLGQGLLAERLLKTLTHGQIGSYAALYSGRNRSILVSRNVLAGYLDSLPQDAAARDEALLVLMLHELVHAADDLRHAIHANRELDFRASFAQSAVFEGHAQWVTRVICKREGCLNGLQALDRFMFDDSDTEDHARALADDGRSPLDRNLLEYSYVEGERFVASLAARADGMDTIQRLLAKPPHDPLQILAPETFPNEARERRNRQLLEAARGVEHPWTRGDDTLVAVATSPLKGVDLRSDPARREAAVDGFTRLVTSMVALQFHDPSAAARPPIEITIMHTDRVDTAMLFADTLHAHALLPGASVLPPQIMTRGAGHHSVTAASDGVDTTERPPLTATLLRTEMPAIDNHRWRTAIATQDQFVVQASGRSASPELIDDYVLDVIDALISAGPT